jgi:hypothetical protein
MGKHRKRLRAAAVRRGRWSATGTRASPTWLDAPACRRRRSRVRCAACRTSPKATRQRVLHAAADLSYVVDPTASRLATGRTGAVGVVVPFVTRWYFATVVAGAEGVLREAGHEVLLYNLRDVDGRDRFFHRLPLRRPRRRGAPALPGSRPPRAGGAAALEVPVLVVGGGTSGSGTNGSGNGTRPFASVRSTTWKGPRWRCGTSRTSVTNASP